MITNSENLVKVSDLPNLYIAPHLFKIPVALDVSVQKPSELIDQLVGENFSIHANRESPQAQGGRPNTLEYLKPRKSNWALLNLKRQTLILNSSIDLLRGPPL